MVKLYWPMRRTTAGDVPVSIQTIGTHLELIDLLDLYEDVLPYLIDMDAMYLERAAEIRKERS